MTENTKRSILLATVLLAGCGDRMARLPVPAATRPAAPCTTPALAPPTEYSFPTGTGGPLAIADLDGDGRPDVVLAGRHVSVLLSRAGGGFLPIDAYDLGMVGSATAVSDLDGDGRPDLVVAGRMQPPASPQLAVRALLGKGDGRFAAPRDVASDLSLFPYVRSIGIADFDRDGHPDLAVSLGAVSLFAGAGGGAFDRTRAPLALRHLSQDLVIADFDRDGRADIAAADGTGVSVLIGRGDGSFDTPISYDVPDDPLRDRTSVDTLVTADFDGDGSPDLALSSGHVLLNRGDGTFAPALEVSTYPGGAHLAAGDVNADGRSDLITARAGAVSVQLGNGDGTFQAPVRFAVPAEPGPIGVADFDGDGRADVVVLLPAVNGLAVLSGTCR